MGSNMPRLRTLHISLALLALAAAGAPASAQHAHAPYAGLQTREIKALSDEQIADLAAGRGMGLALAAELNGYPGPLHVLELADPLALTDAQRAEVKRQFEAMRAETIPLGKALIEAERELDRAFAGRSVTPESLQAATARIAELQGALRNAHLKYHLSTSALLSAEQSRRYAELRGYTGGHVGAPPGTGHGGHRHR
jgi:Spy/CpxP family protein refolding chaperone